MRLTVAPVPESVRTARDFVTRACRRAGADADLTDAVVLLGSEVVTNAFIHGRSEARLSILAGPQRVLVEVADDNSRHPQPVTEDEDALDGRGLAIVAALASRWGVIDDPIGKTVWFEVTTDARSA